jgi:hypothetical protein
MHFLQDLSHNEEFPVHPARGVLCGENIDMRPVVVNPLQAESGGLQMRHIGLITRLFGHLSPTLPPSLSLFFLLLLVFIIRDPSFHIVVHHLLNHIRVDEVAVEITQLRDLPICLTILCHPSLKC